MNKKLLILTCLFFITLNKSFSQCTPNPSNTALITPDTTVNLASGTVGIPYSQIIYIHPPSDTSVLYNGIPVNIDPVDSIVLDAVGNLPPGLSYACVPANCSFPGGTSGCIAITGTPTTAGFYPLNVYITSYGKIAIIGFAIFQADTLESYHININVNSGIASYQNSNFQLLEFGPAPAGEKMNIKMNSPVNTNADFSVFNILGESVYNKTTNLNQGINTIDFSTKNLSPGVYILTFKKDPYVLTRKFVIGGK